MGINNMDAYKKSGCQAEIEGEICGRDEAAKIHRSTTEGGHNYQENGE